MKLTCPKSEFPLSKQLQELGVFHVNKDLKQMLLKKIVQLKRMRHEEFAKAGQIVADFDYWSNVLAGQRIEVETRGDNCRRLSALQAVEDWVAQDVKEVGNPIEAWWVVIAIWLALAKYGTVNLISSEEEAVEGEPNILFDKKSFRPAISLET